MRYKESIPQAPEVPLLDPTSKCMDTKRIEHDVKYELPGTSDNNVHEISRACRGDCKKVSGSP